jgi:hypothetical protein
MRFCNFRSLRIGNLFMFFVVTMVWIELRGCQWTVDYGANKKTYQIPKLSNLMPASQLIQKIRDWSFPTYFLCIRLTFTS